MPAGRRLLAAVGAALVCCGAGAAPLDVLEACIATGAAETQGIAGLEAECPGLEAALREAGFAQTLTSGWRDTLARPELADLVSLGKHYLQPPASAPDPAALSSILQQLASEQAAPSTSWWSRFTGWLRSWMVQEEGDSSPWFERMLERLVQSVDLIKLVTYMLLTLMVIGAVGILVNELRVAGVFSRRGGSRNPDAQGPAVSADLQAGGVDLDALALREQPAALLQQLVVRLLAGRQPGTERSLTHRELVARCTFADAESRRSFESVAQLAERILYGAGEVPAPQAAAVIADGRRLLLQLPVAAREQS